MKRDLYGSGLFVLPLAGGAGRSLRGTAGLLRSLSEQALLNEVPSLLDVGVDDDVAGDVFSAAAGLFGEDFCSFLAETVPPVDSSAERKRANKRFKNLNFDSVQAGRNTKRSSNKTWTNGQSRWIYGSMQSSRGGYIAEQDSSIRSRSESTASREYGLDGGCKTWRRLIRKDRC